MKLTEEEKITLRQVVHLLHQSGMSAGEAKILLHLLGSIENIEALYERIRDRSFIDKAEVYIQVIEVINEEGR